MSKQTEEVEVELVQIEDKDDKKKAKVTTGYVAFVDEEAEEGRDAKALSVSVKPERPRALTRKLNTTQRSSSR